MPQPSPPPLRHTRAHTHRHGGISRPRAPPRGLGAVNSPVGLVTGHQGTAAQSGPAGKAARTVGRRPGEALTQPNPTTPPFRSRGPGAPTTGDRSSGKCARAPPCTSSSLRPGPRGHPHPPLRGSARAPPRPFRRPRCWTGFTPSCGDRRSSRQGGRPCAAPPCSPRRPPRAQSPEHYTGLGAVAQRAGRVARRPPAPFPVDGHWSMTTRGHRHDPPFLPPSTTQHHPRHATPALGGSTTGVPAATHTCQNSCDVRSCCPLPRGTTATTACPAPAPPSRQDVRQKPPQRWRSGGWQRARSRSGCQLSSPGQPRATLNHRSPNRCRPERPPPPARP